MIAQTRRFRLCVAASSAVLMLVALGMFMAVWAAPAAAVRLLHRSPHRPPPRPSPTAAPTPTPTAVCDPADLLALSAWGSRDDEPLFQGIAETFAKGAINKGQFTQVTGPEVFSETLAAGTGFVEQMRQSTVGFYTGHGAPTGFKMLDNPGTKDPC